MIPTQTGYLICEPLTHIRGEIRGEQVGAQGWPGKLHINMSDFTLALSSLHPNLQNLKVHLALLK